MAVDIDLYDFGDVKSIERIFKPTKENDYEGSVTVTFDNDIKIVIPVFEYGSAHFSNITLTKLFELTDKLTQTVWVKPVIEDTIGDPIPPESPPPPPVVYDLDDEIPF